MDDIHDLYSLAVVLLYDPLRMTSSIWCTSFGGEEHYYIFLIWIESITECNYILLDHIVWLCIYRYDDDMSEILRSF